MVSGVWCVGFVWCVRLGVVLMGWVRFTVVLGGVFGVAGWWWVLIFVCFCGFGVGSC